MRALITGSKGQDGSYLAELLHSRGWEVHTLDRAPGPDVEIISRRHAGSVDDVETVDRVVAMADPDCIFNLAGMSSVADSWADPVATARTNGVAVVALLQAALRQQESTGRPVRFVQASSAEIFGAAERVPQDETTAIRPTSPYGASKAFAHSSVGVSRSRGVHASSAILFNHESPRRPLKFVTRKITNGVARIASGEAFTLSLGNLDAERDWGWAPDYVDALLRMAEADRPDDYVIATGVSRSVRDFVRTAFAAVGIAEWERHVTTDPSHLRPVDAPVLRGDAGRARRVLGWSPTVTFEQMVERMVHHDLELIARGDA
ncbi:GDP-mannose 4,6-dehydratase [Leifsonia sp. NPDC077715]|uniref:GDP-mannose 4,6-dehydratase n=1 Tax=Leifsonia sp. NPDC077715 TaxID=3155539 RepID=UPI0034477F6B